MKSTTRGTLAAVVTAVAAVAGAAVATPAVAADHDHDVVVTVPQPGNQAVSANTPVASAAMPVAGKSVPEMVNNGLPSTMPQGTNKILKAVPLLLVPRADKTVIESEMLHTEQGQVGLDFPEM